MCPQAVVALGWHGPVRFPRSLTGYLCLIRSRRLEGAAGVGPTARFLTSVYPLFIKLASSFAGTTRMYQVSTPSEGTSTRAPTAPDPEDVQLQLSVALIEPVSDHHLRHRPTSFKTFDRLHTTYFPSSSHPVGTRSRVEHPHIHPKSTQVHPCHKASFPRRFSQSGVKPQRVARSSGELQTTGEEWSAGVTCRLYANECYGVCDAEGRRKRGERSRSPDFGNFKT